MDKQYHLLKSEFVTQKIILVDQAGKPRAALCSVKEEPSLFFYDEAGKARAQLLSSSQGTCLRLLNTAGRPVAEFSEDEVGPRVALFDPAGNTRVCLCVTESGSFTYLFGPDGKQHLRLEIYSSGGATLSMRDFKGDPSVLLATDKEGGPIAAFFKDDAIIWSMPEVNPPANRSLDEQS